MNHLLGRLLLSCFCVTAVLLPWNWTAQAGRAETPDDVAKKRTALWQALEKALPKEYQQIDVYAENPTFTAVLFVSKGHTLQFSAKTGKVEQVEHMKVLPRINCITFNVGTSGHGYWVMWRNGRRELTIGAGK